MPRFDPKRRRKRLSQRDANVLHGVVLIDVEIASGLQLQVERAVPRHQLHHVIEKANASADLGAAMPFNQ